MTKEPRIQWRWGALVALAMAFLGLYPQIKLWVVRGHEYQGSYVMTQGDETTYSAYVNALIEGRPRRNDPFSGNDVVSGQPKYESLHSIHFIPAYAIALPAKALGISASTAFIWLMFFAAIASSLAIFWLLAVLTGDSRLAAAGVLIVLCFGTWAGSDCCWQANAFTEMFPFLRRYQPAAVFPLFFVFCVFVWRSLTHESPKARSIYSLGAGSLLVVMVFSYFYTWTAAAAWYACVAILWLVFRRHEFRRIAITTIVVVGFAVASLMTFLVMFLNRDPITSEGQLLVSTRAPDLFTQPELIGFVVVGVLLHALRRKLVDLHSPLVLFTAAFALMPAVVFNQQLITGMSLQPLHYKVFIANYTALIAVVLLVFILWRARYAQRAIPALVLILVAVVATGYGMLQVTKAADNGMHQAVLRDDMRAVARRLTQMTYEDGSAQAALAGTAPFPTVFTLSVEEHLESSVALPTDSPIALLWSIHSHAFIGVAESKERFYEHLYYSGFKPKHVEMGLREKVFWVVVGIFGAERVVRGLVPDFKPVTFDEIQQERQRYADFYNNFSREQATHPTLSFVIVPNDPDLPNFNNLDRWYERDKGERVGAFTIYRVKLRS